jgi:hypothetical protein
VVSERVLESTPSRLGLLNVVIEVLELAGGDVAPWGGPPDAGRMIWRISLSEKPTSRSNRIAHGARA